MQCNLRSLALHGAEAMEATTTYTSSYMMTAHGFFYAIIEHVGAGYVLPEG